MGAYAGGVVFEDCLALAWCLANGGILMDAGIQQKVGLTVLEETQDGLAAGVVGAEAGEKVAFDGEGWVEDALYVGVELHNVGKAVECHRLGIDGDKYGIGSHHCIDGHNASIGRAVNKNVVVVSLGCGK